MVFVRPPRSHFKTALASRAPIEWSATRASSVRWSGPYGLMNERSHRARFRPLKLRTGKPRPDRMERHPREFRPLKRTLRTDAWARPAREVPSAEADPTWTAWGR